MARSKILAAASAKLERQLVAQTTEAELLGKRAAELDTRVAEQARLLAEREYDIERLKTELENARRTELRSARRRFPTTGNQLRETFANLTEENELIQQELDLAPPSAPSCRPKSPP